MVKPQRVGNLWLWEDGSYGYEIVGRVVDGKKKDCYHVSRKTKATRHDGIGSTLDEAYINSFWDYS